ncbi:hypothetical protein EYF80_013964 [Liparis tanakae]|uniref:Uncharacterized protein n=1 Tax=Liparis tanakae TaxID=230148 RepID=A0A4Z2ID47_9TELE|nr:hypothetical protein EYF80_013964 [Liparis tanakae]
MSQQQVNLRGEEDKFRNPCSVRKSVAIHARCAALEAQVTESGHSSAEAEIGEAQGAAVHTSPLILLQFGLTVVQESKGSMDIQYQGYRRNSLLPSFRLLCARNIRLQYPSAFPALSEGSSVNANILHAAVERKQSRSSPAAVIVDFSAAKLMRGGKDAFQLHSQLNLPTGEVDLCSAYRRVDPSPACGEEEEEEGEEMRCALSHCTVAEFEDGCCGENPVVVVRGLRS